jgi:hypothetical protein
MRWIAVDRFARLIERRGQHVSRVAVVGGSQRDPEVEWVRRQFRDCAVQFFGIDQGDINPAQFTHLDLNEPYSAGNTYDLVHCAHVLEHLWNVQQAIATLVKLCSPGGLIWVNCPASSYAHGSPDYYSAGYQPELIQRLAILEGAQLVESGTIGSSRSYFYEHTLRRWPDRREYESPLLHMSRGRGGPLRAAGRWARYFPQRLLAATRSGAVSSSPETATQTYVALTRH